VDDDVELKPAKLEASDVASGDVIPTKDVKFKVKIPFQAHIVHNQVNPKPVPTGNFEENPLPKPVPTGVRVIEVNTGAFLQRMKDGEIEKNYLVGFDDKRQGPYLPFLLINLV